MKVCLRARRITDALVVVLVLQCCLAQSPESGLLRMAQHAISSDRVQEWVVLPDVVLDGLVATALLYAQWCNERRLADIRRLTGPVSGHVRAIDLTQGDFRRLASGVSYTPVWGGSALELEVAVAKYFLVHGHACDDAGVLDLDDVGVRLWGRHGGVACGYSPLAGGMSDDVQGALMWLHGARGQAGSVEWRGGIVGQFIAMAHAVHGSDRLAECLIETCKTPVTYNVRTVTWPMGWHLRSGPQLRIGADLATWQSVHTATLELSKVVERMNGGRELPQLCYYNPQEIGLRQRCAEWLKSSEAVLARVVAALAEGERDYPCRAIGHFELPFPLPPVVVGEFRPRAAGWRIAGAATVEHERLDVRFAVLGEGR
jgi:hypothetical protein